MTIRKKKNTIRDVAQLAGVSYQTVSRVINGSNNVAEETRKRIVQAMHTLDYSPSKIAQMLTTQRSNTLELIIVDVVYGGRLADSIKNMARTARDAGYSLLVTETSAEGLETALDNAASRLVDGVVIHAPRLHIADDTLVELCNGIPFVRRDYVPGSSLAWIGFDQIVATRLAVEHLITSGHRHIAAIPPTSKILNGHWRHITWRNVLLEHGLEPGPSSEGDYSIRSAYEATHTVLATKIPFTALLVGTDTMALGAMRALREHGLRIPQDISVVGFDNAEMSAYTEPPLTTIDFKFAKQDAMTVKYLIDILSDPEMELHQRVLMPYLVIRESTQSPNNAGHGE